LKIGRRFFDEFASNATDRRTTPVISDHLHVFQWLVVMGDERGDRR